MTTDLQALADTLAIHELLARYARGVDEKDWELYRSVFTEDATIDYSSAGAVAGTRDEVVAWMAEVFTTIPWTQHLITNIEVDLRGDEATVRALFHNPMQLPGMDGPSFCGGRYDHEVVRTPDGWRSRRLVEHNQWFVGAPEGVPEP
jgi:3-phenylpropionate/cinnamic acid dioxygenase small subunit